MEITNIYAHILLTVMVISLSAILLKMVWEIIKD